MFERSNDIPFLTARFSPRSKPVIHAAISNDTVKSALLLGGCIVLGLWGLWVLVLALATWPSDTHTTTSSSHVHVAIGGYTDNTLDTTTLLWRLRRPIATPPPVATTLVVYVYSGSSDPACLDNLRYFVRTAVKEDDGAHYVFAVQLVCGVWGGGVWYVVCGMCLPCSWYMVCGGVVQGGSHSLLCGGAKRVYRTRGVGLSDVACIVHIQKCLYCAQT